MQIYPKKKVFQSTIYFSEIVAEYFYIFFRVQTLHIFPFPSTHKKIYKTMLKFEFINVYENLY